MLSWLQLSLSMSIESLSAFLCISPLALLFLLLFASYWETGLQLGKEAQLLEVMPPSWVWLNLRP